MCQLVGSFAERSEGANAYRGELLGLMALHLILLAVNTVRPDLQGTVVLHSDCLGALSRVKTLPPGRMPLACKHADILKNILNTCARLTFRRKYEHVAAHQDEVSAFHLLPRAAQLNCAVDAGAKRELLSAIADGRLVQQPFPLEPIACFAGEQKITPDGTDSLRFWIHKILARKALSEAKILTYHQFDEVAWRHVHSALDGVPRLFQLWACKQVMGIANTNATVSRWDKTVDPRCPSCGQVPETTEHVLMCTEAGRVKIFHQTVGLLDSWLRRMGTDPLLRRCIMAFCTGRGYLRMQQCCGPATRTFLQMAQSQDRIGWRRFMEGMISQKMVEVQAEYFSLRGTSWKLNKWASGLVTRLLEVSHGQWLYRNVMVHDRTSGQLAMARKEEIAAQIEEQYRLGGADLLEDDQYLLEMNLTELQGSTGEQHEYWLLAIAAARVASQIANDQLPADGTDYG
jgi:hypothetical protein